MSKQSYPPNQSRSKLDMVRMWNRRFRISPDNGFNGSTKKSAQLFGGFVVWQRSPKKPTLHRQLKRALELDFGATHEPPWRHGLECRQHIGKSED